MPAGLSRKEAVYLEGWGDFVTRLVMKSKRQLLRYFGFSLEA